MFAFNRSFFAVPKFLLWAVFAVPVFPLHAQTDKPCKSQVRANRGMRLVFENLGLSQTEWHLGDSLHATRRGDSIHIQKNGTPLTRFKTQGVRLTGTRYEEFYPNGNLKRVDSLSTEGWGYWHEEDYFHLANAFVVNTRTYHPNGLPETIRYYRRFNGKDSVSKTWHPNGALRQTVWAYPSGDDSAVWHWTLEGILHGIRYESHSFEFYPTGILKSSSVDTLIGEQLFTYDKTYHPNGTLRSVEYESQGIPYFTWLYYNEEGVLTKRVPHVPPNTHEPWLPEVIMPEEPMMYFTYVDCLPEFPGGEHYLKKYLNEKLASVACESPLQLQNKYTMHFTVDKEGHVLFQSIQGENANGIEAAIRQHINSMPRWKPGRIAGRPVDVVYELVLGLEHR